MNRLRDDAGEDPTSERGLELLRATPPTQPMPDMKRRVWIALQQSRMRASSSATGIFGMPGLKVVAMGVTIVSLAGTAGAMMAGRLIVPVLDRAVPADDAPTAGARTGKVRYVRRAAGARTRALVTPEVSAPATLPAPAVASEESVRSAPVRPRRSVAQAPVAPAHAAQGRSEVLEALIALRRDRDPGRAGALLDGYLASHRRGALREEALALAIEAADARGDHQAGERFSRAYVSEFAQGRFRQFALSHTRSQSSLDLDGLPSGTSVNP